MQGMVTVTANDSCPEMLASIRRGPLAEPRPEELMEFLLTRPLCFVQLGLFR